MTDFTGITLLGLGPGEAGALTRQAVQVLDQADELYLRTSQHPVVATLQGKLVLHSFDHLYEELDSFQEVYDQIVEQVLTLGRRPQGVIYAVPGHPFMAEATGPEIYRRAKLEHLPVRVVDGLSFLEPVLTALGMDPFPQSMLVDALQIAAAHYPLFPPDTPALIAQLYSRQVAADVKLTLMAVYPDEFPVTLVHAAGTQDEKVEQVALYEIDRSHEIGLLTCLYVPARASTGSVEAFQEVVAHLRAPDGCPWDRKQTLQSLRPHLLEEAYEVMAALDAEDSADLKEELGDLLLMILMLSQIASEEGDFNFTQVVEGIHSKIVRRHPHVFGDLKIEDEEAVLQNWEKLKAEEREHNGTPEKGLLDGVATALPALLQAYEIQSRASRVGFDWKDAASVEPKIREELAELQASSSLAEQEAELGDLLFSLVNFARHLKIDPEAALRGANQRFRRRFKNIEAQARLEHKGLDQLSLAEMDALWEAAKKSGG
jgi:tetrapyrrole methylase family protein/MazG family protein